MLCMNSGNRQADFLPRAKDFAMVRGTLQGMTDHVFSPSQLAGLAVDALKQEVGLTPKPGLVDARGSGAHTDLSLDLMVRSAESLFGCFEEMAEAAFNHTSLVGLREQLGSIGREGETVMFAVTDGVNTHKGAIWALGLLTAGFVISGNTVDWATMARNAARLANIPDRHAPVLATNGSAVKAKYGVAGARGEAMQGFPHVFRTSLPMLCSRRREGVDETRARLDALMALMASVDDTCVLHRGGPEALRIVQEGACEVLAAGGTSTNQGWDALQRLDRTLLGRNLSPGGCGDLFAATLYVDALFRAS